MNKHIGILGIGNVGQTLANGLQKLGYQVTLGRRMGGSVGTFAQVAKNAEVVIIAVKGSAASDVVGSVKEHLAGKTIIDTTNPISDSPPTDGVLNFFTSLGESLMERLQNKVPDAHFVKAFNSVGSAGMVQPHYSAGKPSMFICGDDSTAKEEVAEIVSQLGREVEDMGKLRTARAIEPLCMLWCIPGFLHNEWTHAFKLLK